MNFLRITNLSKDYRKNGQTARILAKINCDFEKGKIHVVLGPSGCGKTTFLCLIAGLVKPTTGEIRLDKKIITSPASGDIGVVFQDLRLFPWLKTTENIAFGLRMRGIPEIEKTTRQYLKMVGLAPFGQYYPFELSGGMKQRLALARGLVLKPQILLLDEPFGSLDPKTRKRMQKLLLRIHKMLKTTIIFVTHDTDEAITLGDRIYILSGVPGKIKKIFENKTRQFPDTVHKLKSKIVESF